MNIRNFSSSAAAGESVCSAAFAGESVCAFFDFAFLYFKSFYCIIIIIIITDSSTTPPPGPSSKNVSCFTYIFFYTETTTTTKTTMPFLFECLPFELTFNILFRHGGFDALEAVLGKHACCCWEFLKLMNQPQSPRAELLCICRTVQLLDHPTHALFLLNYPPDSSIPENRRAWDVAVRCCVGWAPDVRSVILAMRAFVSTRQYCRQPFPWIDTVDLDWLRTKSEEEWKWIGMMQNMYCKFDSWWWNSQREAFQLERTASGSDMWVVIQNTARAEMERLPGSDDVMTTTAAAYYFYYYSCS